MHKLTIVTVTLSGILPIAQTSPARAAQSSPAKQQNVLAAKPPMGWNSWNHFAGHVTDADVRAAADALVAALSTWGLLRMDQASGGWPHSSGNVQYR